MSLDDPVVTSEVHPGVTQVTFNRPEVFNTLNAQVIEAIHECLREIGRDPTCRVVILTGAGKHFCAGADLSGHGVAPGGDGSLSASDWNAIQEHVASLVRLIRNLPQPVIAAVNGAACGGGFGMALASDIRICDTNARFNAAAMKIGLSSCDMGVSWLLPRIVGAGRAFELLLTGDFVHATEAEKIGLVTHVVPPEDLLDSAIELAQRICANSPHGVRLTKVGMWAQLDIGSLEAGLALENRTQMSIVHMNDHKEAIAAFLEKRPPSFTDS